MRSLDFHFREVVGSDETILWQGKPNKKCFILESIFNAMLPFALFWAAIDLGVIGFGVIKDVQKEGMEPGLLLYLCIFFLVHMTPVWIYLIGIALSVRNYLFKEYIVTDQAVYISGYHKGYSYEKRRYLDMGSITLRRGMVDKWIGVGDVVLPAKNGGQSDLGEFAICDVSEYEMLLRQTKELQAAAKANKKN